MALMERKSGDLEYQAARNFGVPHAFTTRLGGVSQGVCASLNLGIHRGDAPENVEKNYEILGKALGFEPENLILTHQIHSDRIRRVGREDRRPLFSDWPDCDGLITDCPGLALAVFTADCCPVLLWDPDTGAVGAVHAGWRGTAADIAGKAVAAMAQAYGSLPERLHACIGPCIGPCCFETDEDVPQAMLEAYGPHVPVYPVDGKPGRFRVDLKELNALALRRAGVPGEHLEISGDCTMCRPNRYWSHRYTRGLRGCQGAIIVCKGRAL